MITKVHCIVGLPGAGKSWLANDMATRMENPCVIDDINSKDELPDANIYSDLIIADPWFCEDVARDAAEKTLKAKYGNYPNWIFFENNPEKCLVNVSHRNDGRKVNDLIAMLTQVYEAPKGVELLEIWQPSD